MRAEAFLKVINESIIAGWLILAVILVRLICKRASKAFHFALWGLVGVLLICPFSFESDLSIVPATEIINTSVYDARPYITTGIFAVDEGINGLLEKHYMENAGKTVLSVAQIVTMFRNVWQFGMLLLAGYSTIAYLRLCQRSSAAMKVEGNVWICDEITSPFVLGILRPRIYLPSRIKDSDKKFVIAHERTHIRRLDHWWKLIGFIMLVIHWFNPMFWIMYFLLSKDIELACDAQVVRDLDFAEKKAYAETLLEYSISGRWISACPLAFGEIGVKDRIKRVMTDKSSTLWSTFAVVVFGFILAVGFLTKPKPNESIDIWNENNYTILAQNTYECTLAIPKELLPDSVYTKEGHQFREKEIIVYQTDTTIIYLDHVQLANEGDEQLYFDFICTYKEIPESGKLLSIHRREESGGYTVWAGMSSKTLTDDCRAYEETVLIRGTGGTNMFELCVDTEACKTAVGVMLIEVILNEISYVKR